VSGPVVAESRQRRRRRPCDGRRELDNRRRGRWLRAVPAGCAAWADV